jgi:hypothetical protein
MAQMPHSYLQTFFLSAAYGILVSFAALCCFELIFKQLGIGDRQKRTKHESLRAFFYIILFSAAISAALYVPQALGLGDGTVYAISGCLSFFPLYFLFVRRWRRKGWVTPWAVEKKKLRKKVPQYLLAFGIVLATFILTYLHRHPF